MKKKCNLTYHFIILTSISYNVNNNNYLTLYSTFSFTKRKKPENNLLTK